GASGSPWSPGPSSARDDCLRRPWLGRGPVQVRDLVLVAGVARLVGRLLGGLLRACTERRQDRVSVELRLVHRAARQLAALDGVRATSGLNPGVEAVGIEVLGRAGKPDHRVPELLEGLGAAAGGAVVEHDVTR